jgi:hypothetical protein
VLGGLPRQHPASHTTLTCQFLGSVQNMEQLMKSADVACLASQCA